MGAVMSAPGMHRALPVPDGLEGQRVDQALSRLFGLSRSAAADVADAGNVLVDGRVRGKGDRLAGGSWL
jgi:23S rRNA pseudouridine1911/1915/1917 synthase